MPTILSSPCATKHHPSGMKYASFASTEAAGSASVTAGRERRRRRARPTDVAHRRRTGTGISPRRDDVGRSRAWDGPIRAPHAP